jgi:hypothetical protein
VFPRRDQGDPLRLLRATRLLLRGEPLALVGRPRACCCRCAACASRSARCSTRAILRSSQALARSLAPGSSPRVEGRRGVRPKRVSRCWSGALPARRAARWPLARSPCWVTTSSGTSRPSWGAEHELADTREPPDPRRFSEGMLLDVARCFGAGSVVVFRIVGFGRRAISAVARFIGRERFWLGRSVSGQDQGVSVLGRSSAIVTGLIDLPGPVRCFRRGVRVRLRQSVFRGWPR